MTSRDPYGDKDSTPFEERLSDLMVRRSEQARPAPTGSGWNEPVALTHSARGDRPALRQRIGLVAAMLVLLAGTAALLRTTPAARSVQVTEAATAAAQAEENAEGADLVVFLNLQNSTSAAQSVEELLSTSAIVEQHEFVDREETFAEFEQYFAGSPEVLEAVSPDDLPESYRVWLNVSIDSVEAHNLIVELDGLTAVRQVDVVRDCDLLEETCHPSPFSPKVVLFIAGAIAYTLVFALVRWRREAARPSVRESDRRSGTVRQGVALAILAASVVLIGWSVLEAARHQALVSAVREAYPNSSYGQVIEIRAILAPVSEAMYLPLIFLGDLFGLMLLLPVVWLARPGAVQSVPVRNLLYAGFALIPFLLLAQFYFEPTLSYLTFVNE